MPTVESDLNTFRRASRFEKETPHRPDGIPLPKRKWKTRVLIPGVLLTGFVSVLAYSAGDVFRSRTPVEVVPVVVRPASASATSGAVVAQAPGWVEADPFSVAVSALADGVVKEVLVLEGDRVEAGQVVARMIDEDARLAFSRSESEVSLRQADCLAAQAALTAAQTDWDHPIERRRMLETSEAMWAESRAELDRLPAEIAAEQALLTELHAEHERVSLVHEQQSASGIELIRAQQQCAAQAAKLRLTEGKWPILDAKTRQWEAEVTAARENLRLRITETKALADARAAVARAEAELNRAATASAEAKLRLQRMEVRSPSSGVVQERLVEPGSKLQLTMDNSPRSAQAVRLYDPTRLQVRVDVPLAQAAHVGVGQEATVTVEILPDRRFRGSVTRIVHEADIQKNTLQVKVAVHEPAPEIKPEMLARVKLLGKANAAAETSDHAVFAPESLILRSAGGADRVWLADAARGIAVSRQVTVGDTRQEGWVEIRQGLNPGDRLIALDPSGVRGGQRIRITGEAATGPPSNAKGVRHGSH